MCELEDLKKYLFNVIYGYDMQEDEQENLMEMALEFINAFYCYI